MTYSGFPALFNADFGFNDFKCLIVVFKHFSMQTLVSMIFSTI